ncbi:transposase [Streptomyces sp. QL37]|uniref:transposase n=1 Tax=Streptomyces sp. QL37 TaxID=2093747 RepID=UPI000CF2EEBE
MGRGGDPTDAEWARLRPFLRGGNGCWGRWRDLRQVLDGILHRVRTGVQWCDLPEGFGPRKTVLSATVSGRPAGPANVRSSRTRRRQALSSQRRPGLSHTEVARHAAQRPLLLSTATRP